MSGGPEPIGDRRQLNALPGGGFVYTLLDDALSVEVRYLRRDHGLHAEVDVRCAWAGARAYRGSLACADLNLSSLPSRKSFAKHCEERARTKPEDFDWMGLIDAACLLVIQAERGGDEVITLDDAAVVVERDLNVRGLMIPGDAPSMLVAHGDSLKSLLMMLVLGTLAERGHQVLFVDWEWSADRHRARKVRLFGSARLDGLHYLRCRAPLTIEVDRIRRFCDSQHVTFIGIDSVGLACDGKLVDDDVAIRFHRALACLPPSICAAHVPKSAIHNPDQRVEPQAFGSVYFGNLCRAMWTVKKHPSASEDLVTVGLFPSKQNDGQRARPVGFEFAFFPDRIDVESVDLANVEGLAETLPLPHRIQHLLKQRKCPLSYVEIAKELGGAKVNSVVQAVTRGKGFVKVESHDGIQRIALVEKHLTADSAG